MFCLARLARLFGPGGGTPPPCPIGAGAPFAAHSPTTKGMAAGNGAPPPGRRGCQRNCGTRREAGWRTNRLAGKETQGVK